MAMLCDPNMECTECATSCPPTCKDPNPKSCEVKVCNAGCVCVKGYVLNEDNKCIPKTECSLVSTSRAFSIFERIRNFFQSLFQGMSINEPKLKLNNF
jgi:hypothetical protein